MNREIFFSKNEPKDLMTNMIISNYTKNEDLRRDLVKVFYSIVPSNLDLYQARLSELIYEYSNKINSIKNSNDIVSGSSISIEENKKELSELENKLQELTNELSNYQDDLLKLDSESLYKVSSLTMELSTIKKELEEGSKLKSIDDYKKNKSDSLNEIKDNMDDIRGLSNIITMESVLYSKDQLDDFNPEISDITKTELESTVNKEFSFDEKEKKETSYFFEGFLNNYAVYIKEKSIFEKSISDEIKDEINNSNVITDNLLENEKIKYFNIIRRFSYRITSSLNAVIENKDMKSIINLNELTIVMYFITTLLNRINNNSLDKDEIAYIENVTKKNNKKKKEMSNNEIHDYLNELIKKIKEYNEDSTINKKVV